MIEWFFLYRIYRYCRKLAIEGNFKFTVTVESNAAGAVSSLRNHTGIGAEQAADSSVSLFFKAAAYHCIISLWDSVQL